MKLPRLLPLGFVCLFVTASVLAGSTSWYYTHPNYKKFLKAAKGHKWSQAVEIANDFDLKTVSIEAAEEFAKVFAQVNDSDQAVRCYEKALTELLSSSLWKSEASLPDIQSIEAIAQKSDQAGDKTKALLYLEKALNFRFRMRTNGESIAAIKQIAHYVQRNQLESQISICNDYALHLAGKSEIAFNRLLQAQADNNTATSAVFLEEIGRQIYDAAVKRADWPAAAAIVGYLAEHDAIQKSEAFSFADVCVKAGDRDFAKSLCLRQVTDGGAAELETVRAQAEHWLRNGENELAQELTLFCYEQELEKGGFSAEEKIARARIAADFARQHQLKSSAWLINCMAQAKAGDPLPVIDFLDKYWREHREHDASAGQVALRYLQELVPEAFNQAYESGTNWNQCARIAAYYEWGFPFPPDTKFMERILTACEKADQPEMAIHFCLLYAWSFSGADEHFCDPQGDPELIKRAAQLASRYKLDTENRLVNSWRRHLEGNSKDALIFLEAFATAFRPNDREFVYTKAVAQFLCGDLCLEQNQLLEALSWYHLAGYTFSYECLSTPDEIQLNSHYHEVLGITRQARVLLKMAKPALAAAEVRGLLETDPAIINVINHNTTLKAEWAKVKNLIAEAEKSAPTAKKDVENHSGSSSGDTILFDGRPAPRESAALVIAGIRQKHAEAKAKAASDASFAAYKSRMQHYSDNFLESYRQSQQPQAASEPPTSSSPAVAFDFMGQLDAKNKKPKSPRRCAHCLGSGKSNYVLGGKYYAVDLHGRETSQVIAPPDCKYCDGSGWRQ